MNAILFSLSFEIIASKINKCVMLKSCVVLFSDLLILFFLYLEPISMVFTHMVRSPHFILIRKTRMTRMIRIARVTEITKMTLMNRGTV